jgi:hypothetical protein
MVFGRFKGPQEKMKARRAHVGQMFACEGSGKYHFRMEKGSR